jgi:hypothetical protein
MCEVSKTYGYCDLGVPHCKKCGEHIIEGSERIDICNNCTINNIEAEITLQVSAFNGNYEEAAKHFNW